MKTIPNCENTKTDHHMFYHCFFVEYETKINMKYLRIKIGSGLKGQNYFLCMLVSFSFSMHLHSMSTIM